MNTKTLYMVRICRDFDIVLAAAQMEEFPKSFQFAALKDGQTLPRTAYWNPIILRKSTEYKLQHSVDGSYMWGSDKNILLRKWTETMTPRIPNMDYDKNISLLMPQEEPKSAEVTLSVTGYLKCQVSGATEEECRKLATEAFESADFGPLEEVDMEIVSYEKLDFEETQA